MIGLCPQKDRSHAPVRHPRRPPTRHLPNLEQPEPGAAVQGLGQDLPRLSADAGITFVIGPLHLDPGHRTLSIVDASSIEAVTQLVHTTGLSQWNTVEVVPVVPVADMMDNLDAFPIVFG